MRVLPGTLAWALAGSVACGGGAGAGGGAGDLPVAATMPARVSQGIINGELCDETVEPTAVALMFDGTVDFGQGGQDLRTVLCTGTLIAPDVVLLAAHCLDTSALTFGFGSTTREEWYVSFEADLARFAEQSEALPELPASAIPVADTAAHPDFDLQSLGQGVDGVENDIALVFLAAPVTTVVPEVVLTPAEASGLSVGATVRIAGWGQQTVTNGFFDPPPPGSVGIKICGSSTINEIGATLIQIGGDASTTRKCHGDSGGPTYFTLAGEQAIARRVIGVTSRAYDQEDCNKGGVDTRVDAFVDYLEDEMRTRCTAGTRTWCAVEGLLTADDVFALAHPEAGEGEGEDGDDDNNNDDGSDGEGARGPSGCAAAQPTDAVTAAAVVALLGRRRRRA